MYFKIAHIMKCCTFTHYPLGKKHLVCPLIFILKMKNVEIEHIEKVPKRVVQP